ncbi:hypothetical protein Pmani_004553 [Petrolisthes manimaculis]|uniref:Histone deacetylase complex subunit SAP130 C-terminal domain-containing protein n=1 Tax=Petrolisthes manimaculis TaxID=1843537 RepID=A0AAE1QFZ5_9EUCA|nr:hypothetical protein Pmani_004553 [Petrolisthes manimaculis]
MRSKIMSGRSGMVGGGGGGGGGVGGTSGVTCDPANQPIDLVKTSARSLESGSIVKSGNTTLVHYTTGGVAQILTASGPSPHVVPSKQVGRTDSMGVGGQTVTLVSRPSGAPAALNLASGGVPGPSVRTVAHPPGTTVTSGAVVTSSAPGHLAYHIPRGPATVANMAASRSQTVATPVVRTTGQAINQPNSTITAPRGGAMGQRVVPVSSSAGGGGGGGGGWGRATGPSPTHTTKLTQGIHSTVAATSLSMGVGRGTLAGTRPVQTGSSITTYHAGGRSGGGMSGGPIRGTTATTTTMRGMVSGDGPRGSTPKAVHITQPVVQPQCRRVFQKYGGGLMNAGRGGGGGGGGMGPGQGGGASGGGTIYTPSLGSQGTMRPQATTVRITTAPPIPTSATPAVVSSQGGTNMGGMAMTSNPPTHHPTLTRPHHDHHHIPLKAPIAVRTPIAAHQTTKGTAGVQAQTLAFSEGPKVITQPAQGPPLALAQISGLAGVTTQKTQLSTHTITQQQQGGQQQHSAPIQHRGQGGTLMKGSVVGGVGRMMGNAAATTATIPVAKVLPQQASAPSQGGPMSGPPRPAPHGQVRAQSPAQAPDTQPPHTSVYLHRAHTGVTVTSGVTVGPGERVVTTMPQYSISPQYYYEQSHSTYQVGGTTLVPHTISSTHYVPATMHQAGGTGGGLRGPTGPSNPGGGPGGPMVNMSGGPGGGQCDGGSVQTTQGSVTVPAMKPNASPRPSILRKRPENDGTPLKATKNLTAALSLPMPSPPSPKRPDSRGNGNASSGSTTISANSSPGLQIEELETSGGGGGRGPGSGSGTHTPPSMKQDPPEDATLVLPRPPSLSMTMSEPISMSANLSAATAATLTVPQPHLTVSALHATNTHLLSEGLSPRKKPRKQQLMGNELQEARSSEDDVEHPPLKKNKREMKEDHNDLEGSEEDAGDAWSEPGGGGGGSSGGSCGGGGGGGGNAVGTTTVILTNRPTMSLLSSCRQSWKPRHNHFVRHTDVKPKDEKRMTVNEIANQKMALQRVNGWKIVHLSGQVDDLVDLESEVVDRLHLLLGSLEKRTHPRKPYKDFDKDVNRLSELVKANIQRSKIIKDQMVEARSQMHKLFDHKGKIVDIMNKYSSKRSLRKKEKS